MSLYYQDDHVTLHHGDSLEILPTLDVQADALLTDPPYFKVKNEDWDRQWAKPDEFLRWIGSFLDATKPQLAPHASVWVFASPQLATDVEITVRDRFRVLNSIRWTKAAGWHQKADMKAIRSFLTPWEAIIFAEQHPCAHPESSRSRRGGGYAPVGRYLQDERERAGWTRSNLEVALGFTYRSDPTKGSLIGHRWEEGSSLPSRETYAKMREVLNGVDGGFLAREYDDLIRQYDDGRRHFTPTTRALASDIWDFGTVKPYPGKHPCEKPAPLLRHMIETSTRPGALILDPFAGSGSTLEVAAAAGRHAIGIEKSEEYCEKIAHRLSARTEQLALI